MKPKAIAVERDEAETFGLILIPGFSMMSFASFIEPLRQANRVTGRSVYRWRFVSEDGNPVQSSAGARIEVDQGLAEPANFDAVFVCAGVGIQRFDDRRIVAWLQRLSTTRTRIGALSTATFILARAGLLDDSKCTVHWESLSALREQFPALRVTANLFEIDGGRITCAGATACIDLMLHLIEERLGGDVVASVSEQYNLSRVRARMDEQRMPEGFLQQFRHPRVVSAVTLMENTMDEPLSLDQLASRIEISKRQLARLFDIHIGRSVIRHYRFLRLRRAQQLLIQTTLSVRDVSTACGFQSLSHFARDYRRQFGHAPLQERRNRQQAMR
ncbi:MAG: GlxA family transcriptional regulator [Pseudomonadota bacterium]